MTDTNTPHYSRFQHVIVHFLQEHKTYMAFLLVAMSAIIFYAVFSTPAQSKEVYTASFGSLKQYVKVSGQVKSSEDANLSFQTTGQVSYVGVKTGQEVSQGKVLATLSAGDAQASLLQAEAGLASAQAVLEQLKQGARKEELAVKQQIFDNSKSSLEQSYSALPDSIQNVDAVTADIVKNKFGNLFIFSNGRYSLSFASCDQRLQSELETKRGSLETLLAGFQKKSSVITSISQVENIDTTFESAYEAAIMTNDLVNGVSNLLLSSCSASNTNLEGFRLILSPVKTSMTALFSDITLKRSALLASKNAFNQASRDLDLTRAGTDPYKIKAQAASVAQAEASVAQARSGLSKTIITAPFSGVISEVSLSLGETVSLGKTVISMVAVDGYEIEAKVPEIDIVKVKMGALVDITLDAYGRNVIFPAKVTRINPTASTEGSVPVYKVIVTFMGNDDRIKQGMTANVQILTESKSSVLTIPARYVKIIDEKTGTVLLSLSGKEEVRNVVLGARGSDGSIEVTQGLLDGDILLPPNTTVREAQKQTN